jgi:hypothetical protein
MGPEQSTNRTLLRRVVDLTVLVIAFLATFVAGVWMGPKLRLESDVTSPNRNAKKLIAPEGTDATDWTNPVDPSAPSQPRKEEPVAVAARAATVRRDADAILAECQEAASGNWDQWRAKTASYRADLVRRIAALPRGQAGDLPGLGEFPLIEISAGLNLKYLCDDRSLEQFTKDRAVVAAHRWLRRRGVDLIFVPVPKMTEIYVEHFIDPCPPDGVIAPHVRHALFELLQDDVEVVDVRTLLRRVRDSDAEYLYNACDTHWAPRAMRVVAKEVADRIARYQFGAKARFAMPIVRAAPGPYSPASLDGETRGFGIPWNLTREQKKRVQEAQPVRQLRITRLDGSPLEDYADSPVFVMGNSFAIDFCEQLVKEANILINRRIISAQTSQSFADFLRSPELLTHTRVVVWVTNTQYLTAPHPMPPSVLKTLDADK